jgi:TetR/AcrR family transcriptional regulator
MRPDRPRVGKPTLQSENGSVKRQAGWKYRKIGRIGPTDRARTRVGFDARNRSPLAPGGPRLVYGLVAEAPLTFSMVEKTIAPSRDRILDAAVQLFARFGLERTTLADIARRAHLSKATLYHHFPEGKASIFHAAVGGLLERMWVQVLAEVERAEDPKQQLLTYIRLRIDIFDKQMMVWGLDREVWGDMKPWVEVVLEQYFTLERELLVRLLADGKAAGIVRDVDEAVGARVTQALLRGMTFDGPIETTAADRKREVDEVLALLRGGLFIGSHRDG